MRPVRRFAAFIVWIEAARIAFVVVGGTVALALAIAPRFACRLYARALADGRDRRAGFWGFVAAGRGPKP